MKIMDNPASIIRAEKFDSFERLAEIAVGWKAEFRQLSVDESKSWLFQAALGSLLLSDAYFGCHVDQRGSTPPSMRTFAILDVNSPHMLWYNHVVGPDALLVFPTHHEISVQSRPGFNVCTCSIPVSVLEEYFSRVGNIEVRKVFPDEEIILHPPASVLNRVRLLMRQASSMAKDFSAGDLRVRPIHLFQDELLLALLSIVNGQENRSHKPKKPPNRTIANLLEYIDNNIKEKISVSQLCRFANISERTLRNYFERELGMNPKAYLTGKKLAGAHHGLWKSKPSDTLVTDVANEWGFWHMGQFAADYKMVFGELPSQTLKGNTSPPPPNFPE